MSSYQSPPSFEQAIVQKGQTSQVWYRFFVGLYKGIPPSNETVIKLNASPFSYTASVKGFLIISGGTVSAIQFSREGTHLLPITSGIVPISQGDNVMITYSVLPTVVFVPQ